MKFSLCLQSLVPQSNLKRLTCLYFPLRHKHYLSQLFPRLLIYRASCFITWLLVCSYRTHHALFLKQYLCLIVSWLPPPFSPHLSVCFSSFLSSLACPAPSSTCLLPVYLLVFSHSLLSFCLFSNLHFPFLNSFFFLIPASHTPPRPFTLSAPITSLLFLPPRSSLLSSGLPPLYLSLTGVPPSLCRCLIPKMCCIPAVHPPSLHPLSVSSPHFRRRGQAASPGIAHWSNTCHSADTVQTLCEGIAVTTCVCLCAWTCLFL